MEDPTSLMHIITRLIDPVAPYDFHATAGYATYNQGRYAADVFENGVFSRALEIDGEPVVVAVRPGTGSAASPLRVEVSGARVTARVADRATEVAARMVGAQDDLRPFYASVEDDDQIAPIVGRFWGLGVPQAASPFEALVLSILGQQISNHVARILRNLLVETFGRSVDVNGTRFSTFPSAEALAEAGPEALRGIKFSARKAEYICDIASTVSDGQLDLDALGALPGDEVVDRLVSIRGVGPWTANWLLIRAYGFPDGFPYGDLAVQRILGMLYNGGQRVTGQRALDLSQRWEPYRSYVTTYLFAAARAGVFTDGEPKPATGP